MRISLYSAVILLAIAAGCAGAANVSAFLRSYNVSATVVASLSYVNITHQGSSYVLAYYGGRPTLLVNTTSSGYQFVTAPNAIYSIISSTIVNGSVSSINTTFLASSIKRYNQSSESNVTDCILETGLASGETCTIANSCQSCLTSELCRAALVGGTPLNKANSPFGYNSSFEYGLINFEANYTALRSSLSAYLSNASSLSASNAGTNLNNIRNAFNTYSGVTQGMGNNPIFPPPPGTNFAGCSASLSTKDQPWYCSAVGICQSLQYNVTLLGRIQGYINVVSSLPLSSSQVMGVAQNVSNSEAEYVGAVLDAQKKAELAGVLNTTLKGYNQTIASAELLLSRISNASLQESINSLKSNYSSLSSGYLTANISSLNRTIAVQYGLVRGRYAGLNATYTSLLNLSQANTAMLLDMQSGGAPPSQTAATLSFEQAQLTAQLSSRIPDVNAIKANLSSLNGQISSAQPLPNVPEYLSRAIGAPIATALLASTGYSAAVKAAPLYAIIPSVAIGIVLFAALLMYNRGLRRHGRIMASRRASRNWRILMGAVLGLAIIFIVATYLVAESANSQAQLSVASGAIKSSGSVAIAISGQSNPAIASCAAKIRAALVQEGKSVSNATISGQVCRAGSSVQTTDACMSSYASKGIPVVMLSNSTINSLTAYSYYGTVLSQSGTLQFTGECLAYLFAK